MMCSSKPSSLTTSSITAFLLAKLVVVYTLHDLYIYPTFHWLVDTARPMEVYQTFFVWGAYRSAPCDITDVIKSLPWGKTVWVSYGKRAFHCCISVTVLVNTNMIAGGRKKSTTKDLKVQQVDCWLCLANYCQ